MLRGDETADTDADLDVDVDAEAGTASGVDCAVEGCGWRGDGEGRWDAGGCRWRRCEAFALGLGRGMWWWWWWCARTGVEGVQTGISNHGVEAMGGVVYE